MSNDKPKQLSLDLSGVGGAGVDTTVRRIATLRRKRETILQMQDADNGQHKRDYFHYEEFRELLKITPAKERWIKSVDGWYTRDFAKDLLSRFEAYDYRESERAKDLRQIEEELLYASAYVKEHGIIIESGSE